MCSKKKRKLLDEYRKTFLSFKKDADENGKVDAHSLRNLVDTALLAAVVQHQEQYGESDDDLQMSPANFGQLGVSIHICAVCAVSAPRKCQRCTRSFESFSMENRQVSDFVATALQKAVEFHSDKGHEIPQAVSTMHPFKECRQCRTRRRLCVPCSDPAEASQNPVCKVSLVNVSDENQLCARHKGICNQCREIGSVLPARENQQLDQRKNRCLTVEMIAEWWESREVLQQYEGMQRSTLTELRALSQHVVSSKPSSIRSGLDSCTHFSDVYLQLRTNVVDDEKRVRALIFAKMLDIVEEIQMTNQEKYFKNREKRSFSPLRRKKSLMLKEQLMQAELVEMRLREIILHSESSFFTAIQKKHEAKLGAIRGRNKAQPIIDFTDPTKRHFMHYVNRIQ